MFGPIQPTPYDLAFSLFGIPVRVTPWFWVAGVLLGFNWARVPDQGPLLLLIWLGVMFVSILVHEMGHATLAALFGYPPRIMLYQFGGLAMFEPTRGYSTARAILILAAGPAFGFALALAAVIGLAVAGRGFWNVDVSNLINTALYMLVQINVFWTILNLLPVLPLDGGQICREVCLAASPHRGMLVTLWISVVVAAIIGAGLLYLQITFGGIMFLMLGFQSYQELQQRRAW